MVLESLVVPVVIDESLESGISTHGLPRPRFYVVDIIVVQETEVWRGIWRAAFWLAYEQFFR